MSDRMMQRTCEDFAMLLAAKEPIPGGGGAAAYVGALAVALCSMVGNYTSGKKTYAAVESDVQRMLSDASAVRARLIDLVQEDADAFYPLSQAYAIPKGDPSRGQTLEEATKRACVAPLETMRQICKAIDLLDEMGRKGSRLLVSDVGCGALLASAALEAASFNVFVNTKALIDRSFAQQAEVEANHMLEEFVPRARECAAKAMQKIRG